MTEPGMLVAGRYRLDERIGRGGMSEVWRGEDTVLGRRVAAKLLSTRLTRDPAAVRRFQREARILATVGHPGIVKIFDFGRTEDDTDYLIMGYVPGRPLDRILQEDGPLESALVMGYVAQIAETLAAIHAAGVVHRDVKPANVMIRPEGSAVLVDFGIALGGGDAVLTEDGQVLGSAAYSAPEISSGAEPEARSDMYSLGVTAYECLAGRRPFDGTPIEVAAKHLRDDPPKLACPGPVRDFVFRALAKDPDMRWTSASAMAADARAAAAAIAGKRVTRVKLPSRRPARRFPWRPLALIGLASVVTIVHLEMILARPAGVPEREKPQAAESKPSVKKNQKKETQPPAVRLTPLSRSSSLAAGPGHQSDVVHGVPAAPTSPPAHSRPTPKPQPEPEEEPQEQQSSEPQTDLIRLVPSVVGLTEAEARIKLTVAGFSVSTACRSEAILGMVALQNPLGGIMWNQDDPVTVWVNRPSC